MDQDSLLVKCRNDNQSLIWNPIVLILHTCTQLSLKIYLVPTIPTSSTKCHMRFMIGSGMELVGIFRLFSSVRYCILPGAVWCGVVHTFSHTLLCRGQFRSFDFLSLTKIICVKRSLQLVKLWMLKGNFQKVIRRQLTYTIIFMPMFLK